MRFVFVMDTPDRVNPELDTTYGFLEAATARGHECLHCLIHRVGCVDGEIQVETRSIDVRPEGLTLGTEVETLPVAALDAVFIRKDPPFDDAYAYATLLLEQVKHRTVILNDPRGLREANEKLYALNFARWTPRMLVSSDRDAIHRFVADLGGKGVIKPLDGAGGFGVLALSDGDSNARAIVDVLTLEGKQLATVQEFLPAVSEGDKRVLMLDGELLGAILRVPQDGDMRANIHVGGKVVPTELTERELSLVADVGPRLRADGLVFVGLDLIGERLTEVNVTSPTGIRELGRFTGDKPSEKVIAWVENRAAAMPE